MRALCAVLIAAAASSCRPGAPEAANTARQALIDGTDAPTRVPLSPAQERAVGRLALGEETLCTAWLGAQRWVVTAAHCVPDSLSPGEVDFIWRDETKREVRLPLSAFRRHPTLDVAALALGAPLPAPGAVPLELNLEDPTGWVGSEVEVAGAGFGTRPAQGVSWGVFSLIAVDQRGVVIDSAEPRAPCRGDSGGPYLMSRPAPPLVRVVSVESAGEPSCEGPNWGPRIDLAAAWLSTTLADPAPSSPTCAPAPDRCDGDLAVSCLGGFSRTLDCAAKGRRCGWRDAASGFGCLPAPCGALDGRGECAGSAARWCGPGSIEEVDCGARGLGCGWSPDDQGYRCLACTACGGRCVDLQSDPSHCGACGARCETPASVTRCVAGACEVERCAEGFSWMDGGCVFLAPHAGATLGTASGCTAAWSGWGLPVVLLMFRRRRG